MIFYSPTGPFSFLILFSLSLLSSLFSLHGSWSVVLIANLYSSSISARRRSLSPISACCQSPYSQSLDLSTLCLQRRQHVADLSTLGHSISLLFGRNVAKLLLPPIRPPTRPHWFRSMIISLSHALGSDLQVVGLYKGSDVGIFW